MHQITLLCFFAALSLAAGQLKYTGHSSQNGYKTHSKEESNHYEVNHYEYKHKPYPYRFGYDIKDEKGNKQFHKEEGDEYNVKKGSYGYTDAYGIYRHVDYIADHLGFRAKIRTNEPGTASYHPADVSIYSEPPPSHSYSSYEKSTHSNYGHPVYQQQENDPTAQYKSGDNADYEKTEHPDYAKQEDDEQQQKHHEQNYSQLDKKYTYLPVYVSNNIEYND